MVRVMLTPAELQILSTSLGVAGRAHALGARRESGG
jgi:hypothetical protein